MFVLLFLSLIVLKLYGRSQLESKIAFTKPGVLQFEVNVREIWGNDELPRTAFALLNGFTFSHMLKI